MLGESGIDVLGVVGRITVIEAIRQYEIELLAAAGIEHRGRQFATVIGVTAEQAIDRVADLAGVRLENKGDIRRGGHRQGDVRVTAVVAVPRSVGRDDLELPTQ
uniref:Uncharacterized protein n=1 Tax=termite gut metagenome TaxID=433724 RepID=S0DDL7_9ZZZZ